MGIKIVKKAPAAPKVTESKVVKDNKADVVLSEESATKEIEPLEPQGETVGQLCVVGVDMGYTHNLGNFQSARIDVRLSVPCAHAEIDDVYTYAKDWVEERMNALVGELTSED